MVVNIVSKLPALGLSVKLNLHLGHLTVNENGDLAFNDLANLDGAATKTKASIVDLKKLAGSVSQPSMMTTQKELKELAMQTKRHLDGSIKK